MNSEPTAAPNEEQMPAFYGSHTRKVDAKGRFHLPFQFRSGKVGDENGQDEVKGEQYMISPGPHGSTALTPLGIWLKKFHTRYEGQSKDKFIINKRLMSLGSSLLVTDKQGRVAIPPTFKTNMGIGKEVLVVGMGTNMELWAPEKITDAEAGAQSPSEEYLNDFFE